jgi:CheY-like chemotaxis protein
MMIQFDMSVLVKLDCMDAIRAVREFPSREDFWVALARVHTEATSYLQGHTSSVVIYDPDMRAHFLKDLDEIKAVLKALHVKHVQAMLDNLLDAVARMDEGSLTDGIRVFHAQMDILKNELSTALISRYQHAARKALPIVMAVDDTSILLTLISETLSAHCRVMVLDNGYAALEALKAKTPELFLIDIMMPGMSGYQLIGKIRNIKRFQETPIIIITGLDSEKHRFAGIKQGATDFLRKPFSPQELLDMVQKHLKHE